MHYASRGLSALAELLVSLSVRRDKMWTFVWCAVVIIMSTLLWHHNSHQWRRYPFKAARSFTGHQGHKAGHTFPYPSLPSPLLPLPLFFLHSTFSHCVNIKGKTRNCLELPSQGPRPLFRLGGILWWTLVNTTSLPILKSVSWVVAVILKGYSKFGELSGAGPRPLFPLGVILWWSWKTQTKYQIWSRYI